MLRYLSRGGRRGAARLAFAAAVGLLPLAGCKDVTEPLLEAEDPDLIDAAAADTPDGATGLRLGALNRFREITAGFESSTWLFGGLLADEWSTSSTFIENDETDQRKIKTDNGSITGMFRRLNRVRTATNQAITGLKKFVPGDSLGIGEMYFARGFAEMQLAQDFCSAIPLSEVLPLPGGIRDSLQLAAPSTTQQVFERAVVSYDSALALVGSRTDTGSVRVARAARIGKARALIGLGRFADAGLLVTPTLAPTTYSYDQTFALTSGNNAIWAQGASARRYTIGDSLEGNARNLLVRNAIPFFSVNNRAGDPRLPVRYTVSSRGDTTKSQDGFTFSRTTTLYGRLTSAAVVNGIDARLVEAEAALQANNPTGMLTILNALRTAGLKVGEVQLTATSLPALTLPATRDAQINLLFREKAFWTFSRGQRLGDLRRLIRQYGRPQENVFPVGTHYRGGEYGTDVNLPVPQEEENNPQFGASGRAACKTNQA